MLFQREPYIKREIKYINYDHSPNAMEEVIQNIQERINERIKRVEKITQMHDRWCKVSYENEKLIIQFMMGDAPHSFETVTYNLELDEKFDFITFKLSNEDKEREKLHISPNVRAFLDETY